MYTLKRVSSAGAEMYFSLGNQFTILHNYSEEEFKERLEELFDEEEDFDTDIYAFVFGESGSAMYPLYKDQPGFILCENGSILLDLSF